MHPYPISKICPKCSSLEHTTVRPDSFAAFAHDRICSKCKTRYSPPTPVWGGVLMILAGIPLSAFGCFAIITRIASGNVLGIPAMVIERLLGFAGLVAIRNGWKAVVKKNHVSGD